MTLWTLARQVSLCLTISWSLSKFMFIESVMQSNHLILCHPLLLLPSIFPSIRVFSKESSHQVVKVLERKELAKWTELQSCAKGCLQVFDEGYSGSMHEKSARKRAI